MVKFVTKGLNIGKNRLYTLPKEGGLGMFDLKNFISSLQCTWVRRAQVSNDNWKNTLKGLIGNVLDCHLLDPNRYGIGLKNNI